MHPVPIIEKVVAYITRGKRLRVFRHTRFPGAGIQVPAGTLEPDEALEIGVLREAREETGLKNLAVSRFLGTRLLDLAEIGLKGYHRRYFFHLELFADAPDTWQHFEMTPSAGSEAPIEFESFWAQLPDEILPLAGKQNALLPELIASMTEGPS